MTETDISIICQVVSKNATELAASLPCTTIEEATEAFASLFELIAATTFGEIAERQAAAAPAALVQAFPGSQVVNPAEVQGYPQGPSAGGAVVHQFPTAQPYNPNEVPFEGQGAANSLHQPLPQGPPQGFQQPPQQVPVPPAFNPATNVYNGPQGPQTTNPDEQIWTDIINQRQQSWYDNRFEKRSPTGPDFRHKTMKDGQGRPVAVWMNKAPAWAQQQLAQIPAWR